MRFETFNTPEKQESIEKCREEKSRNWDGLMEQFGMYVRRIAESYGEKYGIAEDIEQETMMKIFSGFEKFRGASPAEFKAWVCRVAQTTATDCFRRHRDLIQLEHEDMVMAPDATTHPELLVVRKLQIERVITEMREKSDLEKEIFVGMVFDKDPAEEAERIGISRGNYDSRKCKLREKLRKKLTDEDV